MDFFINVIVSILHITQKIQWVCLLIGSYIFYCCSGIKNMIFILSTTITIWGGAVYINKIEDKKNFDLEELKKIREFIYKQKGNKRNCKKK